MSAPLHRLCRRCKKLEELEKFQECEDAKNEIDKMIENDPKYVKAIDDLGNTSLHCFLMWESSPLPLLRKLLDAYPEAIRVKNAIHMLPLHVALIHHTKVEVIDFVFRAWEDAAFERTIFRTLPLHYALISPESVQIIGSTVLIGLIRRNPYAAKMKCQYAVNKRGKDATNIVNGILPLLLALKSEAPLEVIKELLAANPKALIARDHFNNSPLHLALYANYDSTEASREIIDFIFEANKEAGSIISYHIVVTVAFEDLCVTISHSLCFLKLSFLNNDSSNSKTEK